MALLKCTRLSSFVQNHIVNKNRIYNTEYTICNLEITEITEMTEIREITEMKPHMKHDVMILLVVNPGMVIYFGF